MKTAGKAVLIGMGIGVLGILVIVLWFKRVAIKEWFTPKEPVPAAVSYNEIKGDPTNTNDNADDTTIETNINNREESDAQNNTNVSVEIPAELNLAIPFTSQAPLTNWDALHEESCEEASVLMAARFLQGRSIESADDADTAILTLVQYNENELHQAIDTTAAETAHLIEEFYDLNTEVIYDWTWDDVKQALAQGYPVILPAAGRELGNPNFTAPGPIYHMLVIKGYTADRVITNDPGTRRGADYTYSYDTLMQANHDWDPENINDGAKVILIVKP